MFGISGMINNNRTTDRTDKYCEIKRVNKGCVIGDRDIIMYYGF